MPRPSNNNSFASGRGLPAHKPRILRDNQMKSARESPNSSMETSFIKVPTKIRKKGQSIVPNVKMRGHVINNPFSLKISRIPIALTPDSSLDTEPESQNITCNNLSTLPCLVNNQTNTKKQRAGSMIMNSKYESNKSVQSEFSEVHNILPENLLKNADYRLHLNGSSINIIQKASAGYSDKLNFFINNEEDIEGKYVDIRDNRMKCKNESVSFEQKEFSKKWHSSVDLQQSHHLNQDYDTKVLILPPVFADKRSVTKLPSIPAFSTDNILQNLISKFPNEFKQKSQLRSKESFNKYLNHKQQALGGSSNDLIKKLLERKINNFNCSLDYGSIKEEKTNSICYDNEKRISSHDQRRSSQIKSFRSVVLHEEEYIGTQQGDLKAQLKSRLLLHKNNIHGIDNIKKYVPKSKQRSCKQFFNDPVRGSLYIPAELKDFVMIKASAESFSQNHSFTFDKQEQPNKKRYFKPPLKASKSLNRDRDTNTTNLPPLITYQRSITKAPPVPLLKNTILKAFLLKVSDQSNQDPPCSTAKELRRRNFYVQNSILKNHPNDLVNKILERDINKANFSINLGSRSYIKEEKELSRRQNTENRTSKWSVDRSFQKIESCRSSTCHEEQRLRTQETIKNKNQGETQRIALPLKEMWLLPRKNGLQAVDVIKAYAPKIKKRTSNQYLNNSSYVPNR